MVASYLKERHTTWDEKLPELLFALNTAVQSSTGISPALLLYVRQPEPPGTQRRLQEVAAETPAQEESWAQWRERLDALPGLHYKAAAQARVAQDRQPSYNDAGRREPSFKPGDRVWKRSHPLTSAAKGIAAKLAPKFEGSYWITYALGSNTYRLIGEGDQVEELVAADQLKPCHSEQPEEIEAGASNAPVEESVVEEDTPPAPTPADEPPAQPATGTVSKRGRGRPPRIRVEAAEPTEPKSVALLALTNPRRGRGRPRKH